jgi:hypothetical protein
LIEAAVANPEERAISCETAFEENVSLPTPGICKTLPKRETSNRYRTKYEAKKVVVEPRIKRKLTFLKSRPYASEISLQRKRWTMHVATAGDGIRKNARTKRPVSEARETSKI